VRTKPLHRRTLLRGLGGVAVGLPFLQAMEAGGQTTAFPRRLVIFYTPEGLIPGDWTPSGTGSSWTYGKLFTQAALTTQTVNKAAIYQALKPKITIVKGLDQSGVSSSLGDHPRSIIGCLTATRAAGNVPSGPSIDQFVAARLAGSTPKRSLELGVQIGNGDGSLLMFDANGRPVQPQQSPSAALADLSGFVGGGTGGTVNKAKVKRKHLVDTLLADYRAMRLKLGADDLSRLDRHIASLETLQTEVAAMPDTTGGTSTCAAPTSVSSGNFAQTLTGQITVAVFALKCDLTRVVTLQCSKTNDGNAIHSHLAGVNLEHHTLSHYGPKASPDTNKLTQLRKVEDYYAHQFAALINKLNSIPEGTGTLLDNCAVVWCSNFSDGIQHNMNDIPFVIAGGMGGKLNTDVVLSSNASHAQLWASLDKALGGTTGFGLNASGTRETSTVPGLLK
jgi:hypothetical protein